MDSRATTSFPSMALIRQALLRAPIVDLADAVERAIGPYLSARPVKPGARVALAVGSRGIFGIDTIVRVCVKALKDRGLEPFIVPAMGSHGGATADGQKKVLAGYGITGEAMGVPVVSDMDTMEIDRLSCGMPVRVSKTALEADYILPVNRVKPHTKFSGPIESGLAKMLAVGLGKADGAATIHRFAVAHSFGVIEQAAEVILQHCNVLCGLALVEDGCGNVSRIEAVAPEEMMEREKVLLKEAYATMARIPFDLLDILIVDRIGKNISGIGMDANVTGRHRDITGDFFVAPHARRIFVRDLAPESAGNANGIGLADFTTSRLVSAMDREKTYANALAAISPEKAAVPPWFDTDREALAACGRTCGCESFDTARIVRICDTFHLETFWVSKALESDMARIDGLERLIDWAPMAFDAEGNLSDGFE
ncbi:nickel pincer cofactor-dependent isomerase, group 22 [Desulfosudis oleivorans]|uniref:Iron-sulfur cluster binding protein n=1 Tax=Desulfosudis oleivorans (strain DSM 6200 / JCM 39069 / Hxd3) TaxID=96561 RepID=A8ZXL7_DESOH|nr:lactate racemase domain-containing protein [Desulfosudis oleivorans]ABW66975.1 iron-sulfur cluster binding protein [Desulfosudis oleivorans Hxd3]